MLRRRKLEDRLEPRRPGVAPGAGGARQRHRDAELLRRRERGAGMVERMDDDDALALSPPGRGFDGRRRRYPTRPNASAASTMRLEKPHSLSYHDMTRQKRFSSTVVCVTSKVELCGSWLKSHDTVWSRLMPMMPLKRFDPAALTINSLISSAEV